MPGDILPRSIDFFSFKDLNLEEVKDPHTLGGVSYILSVYINSAKEVVSHLEVELYLPSISLAADSARGWVWLR